MRPFRSFHRGEEIATLEAQLLSDEQQRYRVILPANRLIGRRRELAGRQPL